MDEKAIIESIYKEPKYLSYCYLLTKDRDLQNDLMQHVAIMILSRIREGLEINNLYGYFRTLARNEYVNKYKSFIKTHQPNLYTGLPQNVSNQIDVEEINIKMDFLEHELNSIESNKPKYVCYNVMKIYSELKSVEKVHNATEIDIHVIKKIVKEFRKTIQHEYRIINT